MARILPAAAVAAVLLASAPAFAQAPAAVASTCSVFAEQLVGLPLSPVVESFAQAQGLQVRVTAVDNRRFPVTMDFREDRVNLIIEKGVITEAGCG